jgi:hypothetical protein
MFDTVTQVTPDSASPARSVTLSVSLVQPGQ